MRYFAVLNDEGARVGVFRERQEEDGYWLEGRGQDGSWYDDPSLARYLWGGEIGAEEITDPGELETLGFKQIATGLAALIDAEATAFTTQWWNGLEGTTKDRLRSAIRTHVERGIVMEDLLKDVEPIFGEKRAEAIATTETTRLFARGALLSYGVADIKRVMWRTANDPWVEDMCRELEGQTWEIGQHQEPPRHVRCRCWLSPVVEVPEEYREFDTFEASDAWMNEHFQHNVLNRLEQEELMRYKGIYYRPLNRFLRTGEIAGLPRMGLEDLERSERLITRALKRQATPGNLIAYRGDGKLPWEGAEAIGKTFTDKGFASTTMRRQVAVDFAEERTDAIFKLRIPRGTNGVYLEQLNETTEAELLLPRNLTWRIVAAETHLSGRMMYTAELVQ